MFYGSIFKIEDRNLITLITPAYPTEEAANKAYRSALQKLPFHLRVLSRGRENGVVKLQKMVHVPDGRFATVSY